jgi:NitT/TauT family transport system substrate-binding protein
MSREAISKRQLLCEAGAATALAVLPLARPARAQAKRQVTMRLDWLYQGPNAGFMIAQEKGFYD